MANSLATMTVRKAANLARLAPSCLSATRASSLIPRFSLAYAVEQHGPPKVNVREDPSSLSKWKEEHFVIVSLFGWDLLFFSGYKFFTRGKNKEEKLPEAAH